MGKKEIVEPKYLLDENWGIRVDRYNWTLLHRPEGVKKWKAMGYYATPESMLSGLFRHLQKMDHGNADLMDNLQAARSKAEELAEKFREFLVAKDVQPV